MSALTALWQAIRAWWVGKDQPRLRSPGDPPRGDTGLPSISPESRKEAWQFFKKTCSEWVINFDLAGDQPNRAQLILDMGTGRWVVPIIIMAHEMGGLQVMVQKALAEDKHPEAHNFDYVEKVATHMVNLSHIGFPDLASVFDYSTRWRRES